MKRFACLLLVSILSTASAFAATRLEGPSNISEEAQEYLAARPVGDMGSGADMMADPKMLERMRSSLNKMFISNAREIDPELFLTAQEMGSTKGFWVNTTAPEKPGKVILYFHGGGHILGSAETNLGSALRIYQSSGIPVLSVEYRLAPEHPFPADLDDAYAAYNWLLEQGYTPQQIGVYGDSAGGGISLALGLKLKQQQETLPGAIAVLSPLADVEGIGDSHITLINADPVLRSAPSDRYDLYAGDADVTDPLLSPIHGDYTGFPPLLIQVGTRERLLSDSVRLAQSARASGVDVTLDVWDGMWHGWHDTPAIPEAEEACKQLGEFFAKHLED